ncbi:unnamed protein product [Lepeophtheirus salmonis]|uniref:(salmon louse) hypothetical protein n=1 Tax=Lepeophtheirus salmonis TaxID=72036 RepID=A0A7R8CSP7_LEPSM|nr:unnamed protein product [Lepeophtheirus salmonis]CAF2882760.1 unnamed protein product [Lepeophtheirus salmonis]
MKRDGKKLDRSASWSETDSVPKFMGMPIYNYRGRDNFRNTAQESVSPNTRPDIDTVYGCPNSCTSIKKDGKPIHFFLFPKTDEIRNEWIEFCGKKEINSKMPRICSDHFYPHLINFKTKRVFLEKGVIPTLNLPVKKPLNHLKKKRKKNKGAATNTNNYHPSSDCSEIRTDVNESHHPSVDQRYVADKFDFLSMPDFILYIKKVRDCERALTFTINKSTAQCAFHRKGCRVPLSRITKVHIDENGIIRRTQHSIDSVIQSLVDKPQEPMIFNDYINMAKDLIHEASLTDVKYNKVLKFINEQLAMASGSAHSYSPSVIKLGMLLNPILQKILIRAPAIGHSLSRGDDN